MQRKSYHTTLKELTYHGLLPPKYEKLIPRTNLHRWRNDSFERYVGTEINKIADNHTELIKTLNEYPKMFQAYGRLVKTLVSVVEKSENFRKLVRDSKNQIVETIYRVQDIVPINKSIKIFKISSSTLNIWKKDVEYFCSKSFFNQCNRFYPNQILPQEIQKLKKALLNPATSHWSIKSVFYKGIRDGSVTMSLNSVYKLNRRLGIRDKIKKRKFKKKRKIGIRATKPNQIWHADITILKTLDKKKYCIYLVIDNYSRKVLSFDIRERVSGLVTTSTIKEAFHKASKVTKNLNIKLIVDGGPENNNIYVDNFINQSQINIRKLVALKDIEYSNSMIENTNKVLKYQYLFPEHPNDYDDLLRLVKKFIDDFNNQRPHGQLKGLTPTEAFEGKTLPDDFKTLILKKSRLKRLEFNRNNRCNSCK